MPIVLWSALFGIDFALGVIPFPNIFFDYTRKAIFIIIALSATYVISNIFVNLLKIWGEKLGTVARPITNIGNFIIKC